MTPSRVFKPVIDQHDTWLAVNPVQGCTYCHLQDLGQTRVEPREVATPAETLTQLQRHTRHHSLHRIRPAPPARPPRPSTPRPAVGRRFLNFKRLPVLLHAFAAARTRLEPAPVLLLWGGYPGECEGRHPAEIATDLKIHDDVFFIGWRGHDELPTGLNCADLMVAPAVDEPFSMVYLEAMACGTPPIATATGGSAHTIVPAGPHATGWLVAPDDADDLTHALVAALSDTPERERRAASGRARIQATYGWTRTADRYIEVYAEAVNTLTPRADRGAPCPTHPSPRCCGT